MLCLLCCLCYKFPESNEKVQLVPDIVKALTELFMVMESFGKVSQFLLSILHTSSVKHCSNWACELLWCNLTFSLLFFSVPFLQPIFSHVPLYTSTCMYTVLYAAGQSHTQSVESVAVLCADSDRLSVTEYTKSFCMPGIKVLNHMMNY